MSSCSKWTHLDDFSAYADALYDATSFEEQRMQPCKAEICAAIYGTGNPDISGIGVVVAYILELALGTVLSCIVLMLKSNASRAHHVFTSGLVVFFDSAVYFAMAVQLATIAVMIRKDYGISTVDLGAIETRIAHVVAVISLLPLLYPTALLETARDRGMNHSRRLMLLSVTVALSFYPFLSRCIHAYGASPIGNGGNAEVKSRDWNQVEDMCFQDGLDGLRTSAIYQSLDALELATSLFIYLVTFWLMAALPVSRYHDNEKLRRHSPTKGRFFSQRERVKHWFSRHALVASMPMLFVVAVAGLLLQVVFQLRELQESVARTAEQAYEGNNWGFGQIAAIVLFLPVGVEMGYKWRFPDSYLARQT
ncbi:hypothetical protein B0T10DRAFT_26718 [Thelonectria olida]|uniref:Uncharacterized protein n=1 Tax=Thelonectria olida TaxID=1576542 RepID=A0A9P8WI79_9HYPO|nr:hypothetical protein B0T10DRAFT_26718 [Thelonectria olida]